MCSDRLQAGVNLLDRGGHVAVDCNLQSLTMHNVYAAGDVLGPPALASTGVEQGKEAVKHMFDECEVGLLYCKMPFARPS